MSDTARELADALGGKGVEHVDTPTKVTPCPVCDAPIDAAMSVHEPATPSPGDMTLCMYCLTWLTFDDDMSLRLPKVEELRIVHRKLIRKIKEQLEKKP